MGGPLPRRGRRGPARSLLSTASQSHDHARVARALMEQLRRQRWTGAEIAASLCLSPSTVARWLRRRGLARLRQLEPPPPVHRYQWARPGDLVHLDVKKLG